MFCCARLIANSIFSECFFLYVCVFWVLMTLSPIIEIVLRQYCLCYRIYQISDEYMIILLTTCACCRCCCCYFLLSPMSYKKIAPIYHHRLNNIYRYINIDRFVRSSLLPEIHTVRLQCLTFFIYMLLLQLTFSTWQSPSLDLIPFERRILSSIRCSSFASAFSSRCPRNTRASAWFSTTNAACFLAPTHIYCCDLRSKTRM